nr:putative helicase magatama 3 [Quercus suber]
MVRQIQVCEKGAEDTLIWPLTNDGEYSVRSAYHMLIFAEALLMSSSSSQDNNEQNPRLLFFSQLKPAMAVDRDKLEDESPMLRFYRIVLGWDYFRLLKESCKNKDKEKAADGAIGLKEVKDNYKDMEDYISTFEPLIFEEIKAQITQRTNEDEVSEWERRLVVECNEVDGFHLPAVTYAADNAKESISHNDLLLLSKEKFQDGTRLPTTYAFALVENCQNDRFRLRMYLAGEVQHYNTDVVKSCQRLLNMRSLITSPTSEVEKLFYSLKAHRKHADFLNKKIEMYDELALVVGKDTATGGFSKSYIEYENEPDNGDSAEFVADNVEEDVLEKGKNVVESSTTGSGISKSRKRGRAPSTADDSMLTDLSNQLKDIATALKEINRSPVDYTSLYNEVMAMMADGYSEEMLATAFNHLCENEKVARGFLAKNARLRKMWLDSFFFSQL